MKILNNVDLSKNELQNALLHKLASAPSNPVKGQAYFNTADNKAYVYDGTNWIEITAQGISDVEMHTGDTGNVVTGMSYDSTTKKITYTKDLTALTAHQSIKQLDTTATTAQTTNAAEDIVGSGKVTLHKISKTGSYTDLNDKPTLGTAASKDTGTSSGNVPVLDSNGKLNTSVLPAIAITDTFVVSSEASMLALTAEVGDVAVRTDLSKSFILKEDGASTLSHWQELLTPTDAVTSVNNKTGAVTLTASDVGALADSIKYAKSLSISGTTITLKDQDGTTLSTITIPTTTRKYAENNPALTQSSGLCTWTVTHNLDTKDVNIGLEEVSTGEVILADFVKTSANVVTIKIVSSSNIAAGTYRVTIIG